MILMFKNKTTPSVSAGCAFITCYYYTIKMSL